MIKAFLKRHIPPTTIDNIVVGLRAIGTFPPLLIYQMGKVGSSTIHSSLQIAKLPYSIYHVHFLSEYGISYVEKYYKGLGRNIPRHILLSKILRHRLLRNPRRHWRIITLVREPIHREISDFFENVESYWPDLICGDGKIDKIRVVQFLMDTFYKFNESINYACNWFDYELKDVFNIDIFKYPFDCRVGYSIIRHDNIAVMVLRLEDLNRVFDKAIGEFLYLDKSIPLIKANIGKEKPYSDEYSFVLENLRLPKSVCSQIYSSRLARHFYSEHEINELIQKWSQS